MKSRILFVSTYPDLTKIVHQLSKDLGIPLRIRDGGFMKDGHLFAKKMENEVDVIISLGGTASAINNLVTKIPVIAIPISVGNILTAFGEAMKYENPLALISYNYEGLYELQELAKLFSNLNYKVFTYSNKSEFKEQTNKAFDLVKHTLIGMGACIQEIAQQKNLDYVLIKPSVAAIKQAIISAQNILELSKKEKQRAERLKSIIDYSYEGIISVDHTGTIITVNPAAKKILALSQEQINHSCDTIHKIPILQALYENGSLEVNKLIKLAHTEVLLNRIPINLNTEEEETVITFRKISDIQKIEHNARMQLHAKGLIAKNTFDNIIGSSKSLKDTISQAKKFSHTTATILIEGETGTGKELFAQSIHNASPRKSAPFVAINCAALPENLLESELFGYEEGAFTGARKGGKPGLFELAHNGTIFLDEIGEISPALQSRLLRVLQEKEILRLGSDRILQVNVRVIAATNKNLYKMMVNGLFREDLFFRLNVLTLKIAPLRDRKKDLAELINHFLLKESQKYAVPTPTLSLEGLQVLQNYTWPGNIRELEGFIEKTIILNNSPSLDEKTLQIILNNHTANQDSLKDLNDHNSISISIGSLKSMEMQIIKTLLHKVDGNKNSLAKLLGISRATIWNKLSLEKEE